eukprot:Skav235783  [mRNA]  locus=scaffold3426:84720:89909:- [translate_table: standard]
MARRLSFHRVKVAVATTLLVATTFANGLSCTKSTLFLAFSWHSTPFSWSTFLQSFSEVLAILGVLLCFGGFCYLAAVLLEVFRTCRRTVVHRRRALRRAKSYATEGGANRLDPSRVEYWEGRNLGILGRSWLASLESKDCYDLLDMWLLNSGLAMEVS